MERYANLSGDSSVIAFEIEPGEITVQFDSGMFYLYNTTSTSPANIQEMQRLARAGRGLGSFILRAVKKGYARKWR
jgi:hypothetical protein